YRADKLSELRSDMSDQRTLATLLNVADSASDCQFFASWAFKVDAPDMAITGLSQHKANCFPD
ncbi:hypothetical protein KPRYC492_27120, partial [Klebsiella pneumoniae RYC492]